MGHNITAVIGPPSAILRIADAAGCPTPTELPFGLLIVPLGGEQIDRLTSLKPGRHLDEFVYLSERVQHALSVAAETEALAYIETGYIGGTGSQAAAVFAQGKMLLAAAIPISNRLARRDDPINTALRALGVVATAGQDEFDTLGLGRFRDLEDLGIDEPEDN